jgi:hypothetical protein
MSGSITFEEERIYGFRFIMVLYVVTSKFLTMFMPIVFLVSPPAYFFFDRGALHSSPA